MILAQLVGVCDPLTQSICLSARSSELQHSESESCIVYPMPRYATLQVQIVEPLTCLTVTNNVHWTWAVQASMVHPCLHWVSFE